MEAARAMAQGIENADHDAEVRCLPMADGGEGTARALVDATGGSMHAVPVHDPLGRPVEGHFGLLADGTTAVVETAEASGLALLEAKERNPLIASSYGTGELMLAAVRSGAKAHHRRARRQRHQRRRCRTSAGPWRSSSGRERQRP